MSGTERSNGDTARIKVTGGVSSQWLIAEWAQGAWQSGAQRFDPSIVSDVQPVAVLDVAELRALVDAVIAHDEAMGRQVLYVTPDENRDLHVWSHNPDDGDEDDEDLCLADIATYDGLHPIITALLDLRLSAALLARAILGGAA